MPGHRPRWTFVVLATVLGACAGGTVSPDGTDRMDADAGVAPAPTTIVLLVPGTMITGDYFDVMAQRLRADGFIPVVYESPDLLTEGLAPGAGGLGAAVDQVLADHGAARLHIVAECNGGVATRHYLQALGGASRVNQVVTFVSAHHGTLLSPIGEWVTGMPSLADVTPGSPFLTALDALPWPAGLRFTSIYSCWDELMYPYETSVVDGATNVLFCDHYLGHLDGFWDDLVYARILVTLQGRGDTAPTAY